MDEEDPHYELFLQSIPFMFDNEASKFLITHYLWGNRNNIDKLIAHLRLYDLIRRIYVINSKNNEEPSKEMILEAIKKVRNNKLLRNYIYKNFIANGHFPENNEIKKLENIK